MDVICYVTELLNSQERLTHTSMRTSNTIFNHF